MRTGLAQRQVFICYRRNDAGAHAGRLYDSLCKDFGEENVFFDQGGIDGGDDWQQVIVERLESSAALLVLIGMNWQPARLADPEDLVRREISSAFARGVRVIPILVNDATLPSAADLPEEMRPLLGRQMMEMTDRHWRADYEQLAKSIRKEIARLQKPQGATLLRKRNALAVLAVVLGLVLVMTANQWKTLFTPVQTDTTASTAPPAPAGPLLGINLGYMKPDWPDPEPGNLSFAFVNIDDGAFPRLWKEAHDRGLICGVYRLLHDTADPVAQAEQFVLTRKPSEPGVLVGVYVTTLQRGLRSPAEHSANLHRYLTRLEQLTGKRPFIQATTDSWNENFVDTFGSYPLWLIKGQPIPRGWSRATLEQEFKSSTLTFNGTVEELEAYARKR